MDSSVQKVNLAFGDLCCKFNGLVDFVQMFDKKVK